MLKSTISNRQSTIGTICLLPILLVACERPERDPGPAPLPPPSVDPAPPQPPDAFAPVVEVPPHLEDDPAARLDVGMARAARVPRRDEVGVPPYAGARVIQTQETAEITLEGEPFEALPMLVMLTPDDPERVLEFYRRELEGWRYQRILTQHWFWLGPEEFSPLGRSGMQVPAVGIMEEVGPTSPLMPDARTRIQIRYQPQKH